MPGRTLATWYGSGSDPTENTYQPLEPSFYSRPPLQPGSSQYEQQQHQYGYYPVNQGNQGSSSTYSDQQQRIFSPTYSQQQPPHFSPHSPASPVTPAGSYHYSNSLSSPTVGPVPAVPQHGMNYSNPQQQALYGSALSPGHYGSPNHGQHSGYSPSSSNSSGGGGNGGNGGSSNSQQWQMQQSAGDYSQHHSSPSPQHSSVLTGSPASSATTPSPSPAHTPTPAGSLHSPPPSVAMSGQYPAHHHGRHPPMGSPPQPNQGHNLPSWVHHGAGRGISMHPGAAVSGPPQGPGYYPPHTGHGIQGPPQHAHMASSVPVSGDRRSPLHSPTPGSWNNLGSVSSATTKASGSHDGSGRCLPPPSSHPQQNNSGSSGGGVGGNPLFSLQMLVNQDINRNAAAASAALAQANSYRASTPSATHQQETVDLSSAGSGAEVYSRMLPQQAGPIPLTRTDKQTPQVSEHVSLRNGSIITSTSSASSAVNNTNVTSPPTPLNGEVSSDSAIGSSATSTPSSQPEISSSSAATPSTDINTKTVAPVVDTKTVSVIAQTPPREKSKASPQTSATGPHQSIEGKAESSAEECETGAAKDDSIETDKDSSTQVKEKSVKPVSEENLERCNPVIMSSTTDVTAPPREQASNIVSFSNSGRSVSKQSDDGLSVPSPSPGSKDSVSPVRSPKSGNPKRMKKVDSILENLVESGTKKLGGGSMGTAVVELSPQTPSTTTVVVPASVIVSPVGTSEDSGSGQGRDAQTPSPGAQQKQQPANQHKSPVPVREEDAVSPTPGGGDDSENGKPRRKRKLDKPVRVSKVSGEGEVEKEPEFDGDIRGKDDGQKLEEGPATDENSETKESAAVECTASITNAEQDPSTKPIEAVTVDAVSNRDLTEKQEPTRRRRSSESSAVSPSSAWSVAGQRTRRKSASDQQEENGSSNAGDLLSVLVSNHHDKNAMGDSKPEVKNAFIEVETELEKMFAGIVEPEECVDPLKLDSASPVPMEVSPASKALDSLTSIDSAASVGPKPTSGLKSRGRPKGSRNGARRSSESIFGASSTDSMPKKKKKKQGKRSADDSLSLLQKKVKRSKLFQGENGGDSPIPRKKGLIKGESVCRDGPLQSGSVYDSSSNTSSSRSRGPVIHIEGPRDNPYHVSVVNAPFRGEDEDGGDRGGSKKQPSTAIRRKTPSYHNDLDYRGKMTSSGSSALGMFSSTLSARYDAQTRDQTWICVFCKHRPHFGVGGDLFGPYLLTPPDKLDVIADGSADERDITEEQKLSGGRNKLSLRGAKMVEQFCQKMSRKIQRSHSLDSAPVLGMVPVSSNGSDGKEDGYEVWVHEECAVWAAGVYVVGSRIVGLREAVWSAVHTICNKCGEGGANVGCVRRGCERRLHYGCAREEGWELDEEAYIARCAQHKKGVYSSEEAILPT